MARSSAFSSARPDSGGPGATVSRVYLDYAGFSPVDPRVVAVMRPFLEGGVGNPGAPHSLGLEALASRRAGNGESGPPEPIAAIGKVTRARGVPFHVDAVGAAGRVPLAVDEAHIDLLTLSSNDLYGPPGAGALWMRPEIKLAPLILGGGQEGGYRAGTENLPAIVGMGVAADLARLEGPAEVARLRELRHRPPPRL